jgi:hypothetical protein
MLKERHIALCISAIIKVKGYSKSKSNEFQTKEIGIPKYYSSMSAIPICLEGIGIREADELSRSLFSVVSESSGTIRELTDL